MKENPYEDIVHKQTVSPSLPPLSSSSGEKGSLLELEENKEDTGEISQSETPVYEVIQETSRAGPLESGERSSASKPRKPLHKRLSQQNPSSSFFNLFTRKSTDVPETQPTLKRPLTTSESFDTSFDSVAVMDPQPMYLMDLVRKHANRFPLRVTVEQGFCSSVEEGAISSGERYNFHFLKYTKVVYIMLKDSSHETYAVPLNSAIQFGLVYNPHNLLDQALQGKMFKSVGDMVAMHSLPKVICATTQYEGANASSSVEKNEILIVKSVKRPKVLGTPQLRVYSVTKGENKILPTHCTGNFTTRPRSVCLHLPEILEHVPDPIPSEAVIHIDRNTCNYHFVPENLIGDVITLTHSSIETSLVATAYYDKFDKDGELKSEDKKVGIFDIPVNLEIEVKAEQLSESENKDLSVKTVLLYNSLDPEKLLICKTFTSSASFHTQLQLYRVVLHSRKLEGIEFEKPKLAFANALWRNKPQRHTCLPELLDDGVYSYSTVVDRSSRGDPLVPPVPSRLSKEFSDNSEEIPMHFPLQRPKPVEYEVPMSERKKQASSNGTPDQGQKSKSLQAPHPPVPRRPSTPDGKHVVSSASYTVDFNIQP